MTQCYFRNPHELHCPSLSYTHLSDIAVKSACASGLPGLPKLQSDQSPLLVLLEGLLPLSERIVIFKSPMTFTVPGHNGTFVFDNDLLSDGHDVVLRHLKGHFVN